MSVEGIVMLVLSITLMWGGLVFSILRLRRHPEMGLDDDEIGTEVTTPGPGDAEDNSH